MLLIIDAECRISIGPMESCHTGGLGSRRCLLPNPCEIEGMSQCRWQLPGFGKHRHVQGTISSCNFLFAFSFLVLPYVRNFLPHPFETPVERIILLYTLARHPVYNFLDQIISPADTMVEQSSIIHCFTISRTWSLHSSTSSELLRDLSDWTAASDHISLPLKRAAICNPYLRVWLRSVRWGPRCY
jgi:hypothetical protein